MATFRKIVFKNDEIYHIYNRGLDRRVIFANKREFERAKQLIKFYSYRDTPVRFSKLLNIPLLKREEILQSLYTGERLVDILSYCLMPNHFHFLLKQKLDKGISIFMSNVTNAYTKYFNTKYKRSGPLLGGVFKAVYIESEEQLVHVSRYIHINPVVSSIIKVNVLKEYKWSSYPEYLSISDDQITSKDLILSMFKSVKDYENFVVDQISYAKELESIKHLIIE